MNQSDSVVVRIPRKSSDPNSELDEYRVTPEFLAGIVLEMVEKGSPEALSIFSEERLEEVLDDVFIILDPPKKTAEERVMEYLKMIKKEKK